MNKIDAYLESPPDWQKDLLITFRNAIDEASSNIQEDWKWNVPVFLINGKLIFAMSAFKAHVKYNFIGNGALLGDPDKLFNNGFDSKKSRAIDIREGETVNQLHLSALIRSSLTKDIS